ncbi:MAG: hypothetical protein ABIF77_22025 [bacterium]
MTSPSKLIVQVLIVPPVAIWMLLLPCCANACGKYTPTTDGSGLVLHVVPESDNLVSGEELHLSVQIVNAGIDTVRVLLDFAHYMTYSTIKPDGEPYYYKCLPAAPECDEWSVEDTVLLAPGCSFGRPFTHFPLTDPGEYRMALKLHLYTCPDLPYTLWTILESEEIMFWVDEK